MEMTLDEVQETGGRATVEVLRNEMGAQYANEASPYPNGDAVGWILEVHSFYTFLINVFRDSQKKSPRISRSTESRR